MSGVSTHPEVIDVSQNNPSRTPTVQLEMAAPQTGLRNRGRQIPDGLAHLNSGESNNRSTNMSNLRNIACSLVRLDASALNTFNHSCTTNPQLVSESFYNQFKDLVSMDFRDFVYDDGLYQNRIENKIQHELGKLSDDEILGILVDVHTSTYYAQFIQLRTLLYTTVVAERIQAMKASNLVVPQNLNWLRTPQQYLRHLTSECSETKLALKSVVFSCRTLRDHINHAAKLGEITPTVLEALKKKMEALQLNFFDACNQVGINSHVLIDSDLEQWWDPYGEVTQANGFNPPPATAAEAYPKTQRVNSTLSFLVPVICLLASIPAGLAWSHTPSQVGTHNDGNFYQLVTSFAMQLLGTGTLIWPTLFSTRLAGHPWFWTWVLTGTSIICTVMSVPLYLNAPTAWSALLSFCGNVAQALALLQLVHSL